MIARTWRGATRAADAADYVAYIEATGLRDYAATEGNLGALMLQRAVDDATAEPLTEVLIVSFWESMAAVTRFAGPDPSRAVFYPEDDRFLVRRDLTVDHYEVVARVDAPAQAAPVPLLVGLLR
jgi:heme-degrading monooxygenase HmoA